MARHAITEALLKISFWETRYVLSQNGVLLKTHKADDYL